MDDSDFRWARVLFKEPVVDGEYLESPGRYEIWLGDVWVYIRFPSAGPAEPRVLQAPAGVVKSVAWE